MWALRVTVSTSSLLMTIILKNITYIAFRTILLCSEVMFVPHFLKFHHILSTAMNVCQTLTAQADALPVCDNNAGRRHLRLTACGDLAVPATRTL